ncbi:MAG: hypothetical protein K2X03_10135 [Bryobacteraceae bacterium]|nr:hypothetical protein [Bryobacteraceae bacterium]
MDGFFFEGTGESGEGGFGEGFVGVESAGAEVVEGLLHHQRVQADFDLLAAEQAPGLSGELGD